jgi:hypothetical protein
MACGIPLPDSRSAGADESRVRGSVNRPCPRRLGTSSLLAGRRLGPRRVEGSGRRIKRNRLPGHVDPPGGVGTDPWGRVHAGRRLSVSPTPCNRRRRWNRLSLAATQGCSSCACGPLICGRTTRSHGVSGRVCITWRRSCGTGFGRCRARTRGRTTLGLGLCDRCNQSRQ